MRYLIGAALALIAIPASAQRLDTRRIDTIGSFCRFAALPHLQLRYETGPGPYHVAMWRQDAEVSAGGGKAILDVDFYLGIGKHPETPVVNVSFYLDTPLLERTRSMRAEVDGRDIGNAPRLQPETFDAPDENAMIVPMPRNPPAWKPSIWNFETGTGDVSAAQMLRGERLALVLLDTRGNEVGRLRWRTRGLRNVLPTLDRVDWSCTAAARK